MGLTSAGLSERLSFGSLLRGALRRRGAVVASIGGEWREDLAAILETRRMTPLLMPDQAALHIRLCVRAVRHLPAAMAEAGVLAGGSARLICGVKGAVRLHLFDVFETLQPEATEAMSAEAAAIRSHFGPIHGRRAQVERLLAAYAGVSIHPGVFPGSAAGLKAERFSFVHLDMDLAASTLAGLEFFHPRLVPGGILIGDDYNDPVVRGVFTTYFSGRADTLIGLPWGQVMIVRQGERTLAAA